MDWRNAPISRAAAIPGAMELTLEEVSLLGGLWKLVQKSPAKVFCWAYFDSAFGLSVSKARTRLSRLERAGLLSRRMVGTRPSDALGSQIEITPLGKDLLRALAPLLAQPATETPSVPVSPPAATETRALQAGLKLTDYPEAFQKGVLKLGVGAAKAVSKALEEGRGVTPGEMIDAGFPGNTANSLNEAIERHRPRTSAHLSGDVACQAVTASSGSGSGDWTREGVAGPEDVATARMEGVPVPEIIAPPTSGTRVIAEMIVAEASKRYRSLLCGRTPAGIAERLNELVWSCTSGPLADFGAPVKRVRVGLKLLAEGRWDTPIGYRPEIALRTFSPALSAFGSQ